LRYFVVKIAPRLLACSRQARLWVPALRGDDGKRQRIVCEFMQKVLEKLAAAEASALSPAVVVGVRQNAAAQESNA
jgi:hypothetical protein